MSGQTKMIIITSDEDIMCQFALNQNKNTHVIGIDNNQQMTIIETNDNNTINLNYRAELNSTNNQTPKRTVETADQNQSKSVKTRKKSTDLICTICGDHAIGYNYAVLSCASCKAFFHRNGQQDSKRFKCLTGHGPCIIEHKISRKCYRCRLERCFTMGMRKDLILSQQEIQRRKDLSTNRNISSTNTESILPVLNEIDRLPVDMDENHKNINSSLTAEDLLVIQNIESSFSSIFQAKCDSFTNLIDFSNHTSELIGCLQFNNEIAFRFIKFCRSVNEFENSDADDRFTMIKYNLLPLLCILTCYRSEQTISSSSDREHQEDEEVAARHAIYILCNRSDYLYESVLNIGVTFSEIVEHDPTLLSLLLVTFLFSKGLSMNENEPIFKDSLSIYRIQSYYTKLLWNYMIQKHGETKTCKYLTKLLTAIFRTQSSAVKFREFLGSRVTTLDSADEIAPLMQTILHIS